MRRQHFFAITFTTLLSALLADTASAYYHPGQGRFLQRDPINQNRPGGGYQDGMNLYQYQRSNPVTGLDPSGEVVVLIHGVNTTAGWYSDARSGLNDYWANNCGCSEEVIEFKWGDIGTYWGHSSKQGGHPNYATDNVDDIYSSG